MKHSDAFEVRKSEKSNKCHINATHLIRIMDYQKRHFLSIKEVSNLIGISISTINRQVKKGTFPTKHKFSTQRMGFLKYQIDQWIEGKRNTW